MAGQDGERKARSAAAERNVVVLAAGTTTAEVPALCAQVRSIMQRGHVEVVCDVSALPAPDCATVEVLCRLQLTARRERGCIRLRGPSRELVELLVLVGLDGVLAPGAMPAGDPEGRRAGRTFRYRGRT